MCLQNRESQALGECLWPLQDEALHTALPSVGVESVILNRLGVSLQMTKGASLL